MSRAVTLTDIESVSKTKKYFASVGRTVGQGSPSPESMHTKANNKQSTRDFIVKKKPKPRRGIQ